MLIISRKAGESLVINNNIEVCILEINDNFVKIGIDAPKNIKILRKELVEEVEHENVESSKGIEKIFKFKNKE